MALQSRKTRTNSGKKLHRSGSAPALDYLGLFYWGSRCLGGVQNPKRNTMVIVMAIVPTVRHTMVIGTDAGITGVTTSMAANLVVIMVAVDWTNIENL